MKIRILLPLIALTSIAHAQTAPETTPFLRDVPRDHWAFAAIQRLAGAGILEGYPAPIASSPTQRVARSATKTDWQAIATIKTKVALSANAALKGTLIDVAANASAQTLTLRGTAKSEAQKQLASAIARKNAPGFAIVNQLRVAR